MLAQQRYDPPGFNQNAGQAFSRGGATRGGDDDFARASIRDGGDRVLNKPFNATVSGGEGMKAQNNRNTGNYAASGQVDNIMKKELFSII